MKSRIYSFVLTILMMFVSTLSSWAIEDYGSAYFKKAENWDAYDAGGGKIHVKLLVFACGERNNYNAGLGQNSSLGFPNPNSGARLIARVDGDAEWQHVLYWKGDNYRNKEGRDPENQGTVWFKVMDGTVVVNAYDGTHPTFTADNEEHQVDIRREPSGAYLTYFEFDWYPSSYFDKKEFELATICDLHRSGGTTLDDLVSFSLITYRSSDNSSAPILSEAFPAMGNQMGTDSVGKMALNYSTMQKPLAYYTSLDPTRYACTDQTGMLYVNMQDTVTYGYRACFLTERDISSTDSSVINEWRWSNRVNISAYHAIHDMSAEAYTYKRDSLYYQDYRYRQISWKVYYPDETDAINGDMFELQRAYNADFSDAETISIIPMEYDSLATDKSGDFPVQTYTYVDSVPEAWYNPVENSYAIYYRVRRASSSVWGWDGHHNAASVKSLPESEYAQLGFKESSVGLVKDSDFANNHQVHLAIPLVNLNSLSDGSVYYFPRYSRGYWSSKAKLKIHKILEELNDTIDIEIPTISNTV